MIEELAKKGDWEGLIRILEKEDMGPTLPIAAPTVMAPHDPEVVENK